MDLINPDLLLQDQTPVPALPQPEGHIVRVATADAFVQALNEARPHTCILLEDGIYSMPLNAFLRTDDVQIRSASGNRDAVIIDGMQNHMDINSSILHLTDARRAVIADVTFANSKKYGIMVYGDGDVQDLLIHNVVFRNCWCRGLKGTDPYWPNDSRNEPKNSDEVREKVRPHNGIVRYCLFTADHIKTDRDDGFDGDYIAGIDMVGLSHWHFHDNVFCNIQGANGGGRGAIFIWVGSDNLLIENNTFAACDRSIALGNPSYDGLSVDGALIRNNTILTGVNRGIECNSTVNVEICNNRIYATHDEYPAIEYIDGSAEGDIHDNIIHGRISCEEEVRIENNRIGDIGSCFKDPYKGDFELK